MSEFINRPLAVAASFGGATVAAGSGLYQAGGGQQKRS